jgi:hypothetical protein
VELNRDENAIKSILIGRLQEILHLIWTGKLQKNRLKGEFERLMCEFVDFCNFQSAYDRLLHYVSMEGHARFGMCIKFSQQTAHKSLEVL